MLSKNPEILRGQKNHVILSVTKNLPFCLGIILIGVLIQLLGKMKGNPLVFPSVIEILKTFFALLGMSRTYRLILTTLIHLFVALVFASVLGILLGVAEGFSNFVSNLLKPLMIMLRSIPIIVLVVIIMVLSPYRYVPYLAPLFVLLPLISEGASEGVRRVDRDLIDVYRLNSSFSPRILLTVYLPLMSGYLKQAYINAVGMGIKIIVTSEYLVQSKNSLGKAVYSSSYFNNYEEIYAYALLMIFLVLIFTEAPLWIMKKITAKTKASHENQDIPA